MNALTGNRSPLFPESSWFKKLREHSLYDTPVIMTYYIEEGVKITSSVIIKDNYADQEGEYIILANGTLVALHRVVDIFAHPVIKHEVEYKLVSADETYTVTEDN